MHIMSGGIPLLTRTIRLKKRFGSGTGFSNSNLVAQWCPFAEFFPNAPQKGSRFKVGLHGWLPNVVALCPQSVRKRPRSVREAFASVREWRNACC